MVYWSMEAFIMRRRSLTGYAMASGRPVAPGNRSGGGFTDYAVTSERARSPRIMGKWSLTGYAVTSGSAVAPGNRSGGASLATP